MNDKPDFAEIIINVAQNIFSKFGYKKTTMDDIANAINKGKSTLYYYFASKEDVFKAVIEKESLYLKSELKKVCDQEDTSQEKICKYFITRMRIISKLANFYAVLKNEYFDHYAFVEKIREKHFADEIEMIKNVLQEGIDKNEFAVNDPELISKAIIIALKGFEYTWAIEKDHAYNEKYINGLLDVLFCGLLKR